MCQTREYGWLSGRVWSRPSGRRVTAASLTFALVLGLLGTGSAIATAATDGDDAVVGTVERLYVDDPSAVDDDPVTLLRTGSTVRRIDGPQADQVPAGSTARLARGRLTTLASPAAPARRGALTGPAGPHQVTVLLATWPGMPADGTTPAQLQQFIDGPVNDYWSAVTGGAVTFRTAAAVGWTALSTAPCVAGDATTHAFEFWREAMAVTGFVEGPGRHLVVYFPPAADACGGSVGLGTIGHSRDSGGMLWTAGRPVLGVVGHELGHNLGLGHSQEMSCTGPGGRVVDGHPEQCTSRAYRDLRDIMGLSWGNVGYLNAVHQEQLGVLPADSVVDVLDAGRFTIRPMASGDGVRALRVPVGGDTYYVEYRAAVGMDAFMTAQSPTDPGVTIRRVWDPQNAAVRFTSRESYLLDGDPQSEDAGYFTGRQSLPIGTVVQLADDAAFLRVDRTGTTATVSVSVGNRANLPAETAQPSRPEPENSRSTQPAAPVISGPTVSLGAGSVFGMRVPVRLAWDVHTSAPTQVALNSRPVPALGSLNTSVSAASNAWRATTFRVTATSPAGIAPVTGRAVATAQLVAETARNSGARTTYSGSWRDRRVAAAVGGREQVSSSAGSRAVTRAYGRSFGVLATSALGRGKVSVHVDGRLKGIVDLGTRGPSSSRIAYVVTFPKAAWHTVTVTNLGSRNRPTAGYDGLAILR